MCVCVYTYVCACVCVCVVIVVADAVCVRCAPADVDDCLAHKFGVGVVEAAAVALEEGAEQQRDLLNLAEVVGQAERRRVLVCEGVMG